MIHDLDTEDFSGVFESLRDFVVLGAGGEDSGGMVVGYDNGDGSGEDCSLKDFSWMDHGRIGRSNRNDRVAGNLMGSVKVQGDEVFSAVVGED